VCRYDSLLILIVHHPEAMGVSGGCSKLIFCSMCCNLKENSIDNGVVGIGEQHRFGIETGDIQVFFESVYPFGEGFLMSFNFIAAIIGNRGGSHNTMKNLIFPIDDFM